MPTKTSRFMKSKYLKSGFRFAEISCDKKLPVISRGVILILSLVLRPGAYAESTSLVSPAKTTVRATGPGLTSRAHEGSGLTSRATRPWTGFTSRVLPPRTRAWSRQPSSRSRPHQRATGPGPTSTGSVSPAESPGTASPTEPPGLVSSAEPTAPVSLAASTGPGFTSRSHRLGLNSRAHETGLICWAQWKEGPGYQRGSQAVTWARCALAFTTQYQMRPWLLENRKSHERTLSLEASDY